ncbi:MAG TPA: DUF488 domain-containing protein [Bryobacteraceae bacterium]|nr:DUF488 domain-containing protein [Bryobacteraceae bacterium]
MPPVLTIGHSTRTFDELARLLRHHGVARLVDVRTVPRSRRNPQFNLDALAEALSAQGMAYTHMAGLGGLRKPRADSPNAAWRNESFRGYADYMQTSAFAEALAELIAVAGREQVAIMCAEAVPWRCHRSLIADALSARGVEVRHIMGNQAPQPHAVTRFARVEGQTVTYPPEQPGLDLE